MFSLIRLPSLPLSSPAGARDGTDFVRESNVGGRGPFLHLKKPLFAQAALKRPFLPSLPSSVSVLLGHNQGREGSHTKGTSFLSGMKIPRVLFSPSPPSARTRAGS